MVERWTTGHLHFTIVCADIRSTLRRGHYTVSDIHKRLGGGRTNPHVSSLRRAVSTRGDRTNLQLQVTGTEDKSWSRAFEPDVVGSHKTSCETVIVIVFSVSFFL